MKKKMMCYKTFLNLLLTKEVPDEVLDTYFGDDPDLGFECLRDFVMENMHPSILSWSTALGIVEAADKMYETALENGNLR